MKTNDMHILLERFDRIETRLESKIEKDCHDIKEHLRLLNGKVAQHEKYINEDTGEKKITGRLKENIIPIAALVVSIVAFFIA